MSSYEEMVNNYTTSRSIRLMNVTGYIPNSLEVHLTYKSDENIDYNVIVRMSDEFNVLFYNLSFFDNSTEEHKYEEVTYNFNNQHVYKETSSMNFCDVGQFEYDIPLPIATFAYTLWTQNKRLEKTSTIP